MKPEELVKVYYPTAHVERFLEGQIKGMQKAYYLCWSSRKSDKKRLSEGNSTSEAWKNAKNSILAPNKTLKEWINETGFSSVNACIEKFLDLKIVKKVSSVGMDWDEYLAEIRTNAPFKANHVFYFVVLENGYAIGHNEHPSKGWSTPMVKYKGSMLTDEQIDVIVENALKEAAENPMPEAEARKFYKTIVSRIKCLDGQDADKIVDKVMLMRRKS